MDILEFDPNLTTNTDTTTEVEGYDDHVEEIENAYPEEDWRTPAEIEAEQQAQAEQQAPQPEQEVPTEEPVESEEPKVYGPNRFEVDPVTGLVSLETLRAAGISPEMIKMANAQQDFSDEERDAFTEYFDAGGDNNLEATLTLMTKIRNSKGMTDRFDRNGDGQVSFSDWFDVSRMGEISPEREAELTEKWLTSLQNKDFRARLGALANLQPMVPYYYQRRKGILGPEDELDGEQARASWLAGLQVTTQGVLSAPEKIAAGFRESDKSLGTGDDWFNEDAFESHDAVADDVILNHKNPLSLSYAINNPTNRVWSDPVMFEIGRYTPAIAASMALPGGWTSLAFKNPLAFAGTFGRASAVTWATETIPTNIFTDMNHSAMRTFHNENPKARELAENHPEMYIEGYPMMYGIEGSFSRKLEFMRGEMTWDAGGLLAGNILMRSAGKTLKHLSKAGWEKLRISTKARPKAWNPIDLWKKRTQVLDDTVEAATDQAKMAAEGPASKWADPWATDGELDSTYGWAKNGKTMSGQGDATIRGDILDITNQADEIRGQIGVEGGSVDELFTPVQKAEFRRSNIPDPWYTKATDEYWNSPALKAQLADLNPLARTLGNYAESTLKNIQELMGRDAASLEPREFWGNKLFDTKLEPGSKLDGAKRFVIQNMQVADAVNQSLLRRLRDLADATGEQLGKGDIFSTNGPMRKIADNLVLGLSNVKKTQFTWELATKRMQESGGELTEDMIKEIQDIVADRSVRLHKEQEDGVRLMMQVLENSDSDELAEGILDVFKASDSIHNWKDFDAWMRQKISGGEFNGKVKTGVLISELQGVMVNSILSGPKTPLRAILGTTTNSYLNALNEAAGATLRAPFTNDIASRKASMAKLKGMIELIPESLQVFRKQFKSKWNANLSDIRTRYSEAPTGHDQNWDLYGKWTERNGTAGDKAAFYIANVARKLNNNKLLSWSPRALAATDDTFKWLLARARSKEIGMRQALEVAGRDHVEFSADLMKQAEDIHMKNLLDVDGNIDLSQDAWLHKQFKEVTLTSELKGFSAQLDNLFNSTPLMKPFYLFARTGVNGLNFTYKNTPLLGALHKESIDILRHTGEDFTPLFKYGIENANDLANARNLFAGRQAVGAGVVMGMGGMYAAGQLTGNGPADRQLKQQWINAGWKPNHLYIGDVGFNYSSLEPYNTIFSSIADIGDNMELMGSEWAEKRLQAVAFVLGRGLTNKTYMSGLDQLMQVMQMKPGAIDKAGANILNNSVPLAGLRNEFGKWANPHMKELNSDMWSSIRNRNQASEFLAADPLPEKSDLLNGKPINNWNIIGRSFNAVSPIQLDIRNDTPGRKLLLDSNYDLKSTTYAYGGYSFVKDAHVRAHFQNAIGTVPITVGFKKFKNVEEALNHLATRKDIKNSMEDMKRDGKNPANWDLDPNTYPHNTLIDNVMNQARSKAWAKINDPKHPGYIAVQKLKQEKDGKDRKTRDNRSEILELSFPQQQVDQFPK